MVTILELFPYFANVNVTLERNIEYVFFFFFVFFFQFPLFALSLLAQYMADCEIDPTHMLRKQKYQSFLF